VGAFIGGMFHPKETKRKFRDGRGEKYHHGELGGGGGVSVFQEAYF